MNKFIIMLMSLIVFGCNVVDERSYYLCYEGSYIPDSLKPKYIEYVQTLVKNASYHMSTADYEDPEDVIVEARNSANALYSVPYYTLCSPNNRYEFDKFTPRQTRIFDSLINIHKSNMERAKQ